MNCVMTKQRLASPPALARDAVLRWSGAARQDGIAWRHGYIEA